jgi:2',3'-cyclic-nucleotide 2'-phosphodiesterase (5'-nucleotidase family)
MRGAMALIERVTLLLFTLCACAPTPPTSPAPAPKPTLSAQKISEVPGARFTLTVIGTNDLHGHLEALPLLGGYVEHLRALRATPGPEQGAVLLLDAGDMFQGTLESNQDEGLPVVEAYNLLGYTAAAIGNHEFDYGPLGPHATPQSPNEDPFGALARNAFAAQFVMLNANLQAKAGGALPIAKVLPSTIVTLPLPTGLRLRVGLVGATTKDTLKTTIGKNVESLTVAPLAEAAAREASKLRAEGADLVLLLTHAGSKCSSPEGRSASEDGCAPGEELESLAAALPPKAIDGIVAGHTHAAVASSFSGIPAIESFSYGRAFGRIDYTVTWASNAVLSAKIFPPRLLCSSMQESVATCTPQTYEGAAITRSKNAQLLAVVDAAVAKAKAEKARSLGVNLAEPFLRSYDKESALGNLFADLLVRHAKRTSAGKPPKLAVGVMNGGGLRENLPKGQLLYGALFEAMPFDNRVASAVLRAQELAEILAEKLKAGHSYFSVSGVTLHLRPNEPPVLRRTDTGKPVPNDEPVLLVASDFLLDGGDNFWSIQSAKRPPPYVTVSEVMLRDAFEEELKALGKQAGDKGLKPETFLVPGKPRTQNSPSPR